MGHKKINYLVYIGTTKIALFEIKHGAGKPAIIERVKCLPAHGFKSGIVFDLKKATKTLAALASEVNRSRSSGIISCRVVVSCAQLKEYIFQSSVYFQGNPHPITMKDVREVIAQTRSVATIPLRDVIVQPVVQEFLVNDLSGVQNPIGLEATRLGVTLRLLTLDYLDYANLVKIFERCEMEVMDVIPGVLAAAHAVLTQDERQSGVILVVVGGEATHFVCYKNCVLLKTRSLPIGSDVITAGLERKLNVDHEDAKRLKEVFGAAYRKVEFQDELIPIPAADGTVKKHIRRTDFEEHLEEGLQYFFSVLEEEIEQLRSEFSPLNQVVLTGGGIKLDGFLDRLKEKISSQFRLGTPHTYAGPQEFVHDPMYAAAVGGVDFSGEVRDEDLPSTKSPHWLTQAVGSVREWVYEYF